VITHPALLAAVGCLGAAVLVPSPAAADGVAAREEARAMEAPALQYAKDVKKVAARIQQRIAALAVRNERCSDRLGHAPVRAQRVLIDVASARGDGIVASTFAPALTRFAGALRAAKGDDAILDAGADAFGTAADVVAAWSRKPTFDLCNAALAWSRTGYAPSATPRAEPLGAEILGLQSTGPAIARAVRRLYQLGTKGKSARAWEAVPFTGLVGIGFLVVPDVLLESESGGGGFTTFGPGSTDEP
jgi:hypothetical protein